MPKQVPTHPDSQITPWLWGLLPDNDAVLSRWAREFHVSSGSAFSMLATPVGEDCPGAIRLITTERLEVLQAPDADLSNVEWLTDAGVAKRLRDLRADNTAWLGARHGGRFSLAGAQAKTALLLDPTNGWGAPQGSTATTHILKPAIEGRDDHDLNEHLCLSAMRIAGLRAVRSRVQRFEDQSAIVVTRYDRISVSGLQVRVHQEDMCQALGLHPTRKYQNEGGPGPKEVAALFRRVMPRGTALEATRSFLDALIWNWIIAGTDAHAKNYSLMLNQNQVRLAPFYDVASALPYDIAIQKQRLAMKFGSSYKMNPVSSPWARLAADLALTEAEVRDHAQSLLEAAPDAFSSAAAEAEVRMLNSRLPARLSDLVAARVLDCGKLLLGRAAPTTSINALGDGKVPRSRKAIEALTAERTGLWEYLLYGGLLRQKMDELEPKYRDFAMGYARRTGRHVPRDDLPEYVQQAIGSIQGIVDNFNLVFDPNVQELAFGKPGEPGDVDRILHLAERFVSVYEDFMDWAAELRGTSASGDGAEVFKLLARWAEQPVEECRRFVNELVTELDTATERIARGEKLNLTMTVTLQLDEAISEEMHEKLREVLTED